jgi:cation diffusion facilitator family transporter
VARLLHPVHIAFNEAIPVACLGLGVNLLSAWLLKDDHDHHHGHAHDDQDHDHDHDHGHDHDHDHGHDNPHHRDLNLRAAYVHVLADAAVSVFAITGLLAGRVLGWVWMDPLMGIVGAVVISNWSWGLVRAAGAVLLDRQAGEGLAGAIAERLETDGDRISDLHLWRVGPGHNAAIISLVTHTPQEPSFYKARLGGLPGLSHVTVEIERCVHAAA